MGNVTPPLVPPRRILVTADTVSGRWRYALDLAHGFAAAGVEVIIAVLGPPPAPAQLAASRRVHGLRIVATGLPLDATATAPGALNQASAVLARLAGRLGVETAHLHTPALACTPWPVPVVAVMHGCVGTWWRAVRPDAAMPADLAWRCEAVAHGLNHADRVLAPSRAFARQVVDFYPHVDRVFVVHAGQAPVAAPGGPRRDQACTAGRLWDLGANLGVLDDAAPYLGMPVLAAGAVRAPHGARVRLANLRCCGELDAAARAGLFAQSRFYVGPALYAPFGLAVLQAAGAGCVPVLADMPTYREIWENAALFFDPHRPEALVAALQGLRRNPALEARLRGEAQRRAGMFTPAQMARATLAHHAALRPPAQAQLAHAPA